MKYTLIIFQIILISYAGYGQPKKIFIPKEVMKYDTAYWLNRIKEDSNTAGLPNLIKTGNLIHFRYSTDVQSVDIWTNDHKSFYGLFANFTSGNSYKREKKKLPREFYFNVKPIDTGTAKQAYILFQSMNIFQIPSCDSIKGWERGLDGMDYEIEYSTPQSYSFKYYWSPDAEGNLKEAVAMDTLISKMEQLLKMRQTFDYFIYCLPAGVYSGGGIIGISTSTSQKEKKGTYREKPLN
jgi:hypothetical protein